MPKVNLRPTASGLPSENLLGAFSQCPRALREFTWSPPFWNVLPPTTFGLSTVYTRPWQTVHCCWSPRRSQFYRPESERVQGNRWQSRDQVTEQWWRSSTGPVSTTLSASLSPSPWGLHASRWVHHHTYKPLLSKPTVPRYCCCPASCPSVCQLPLTILLQSPPDAWLDHSMWSLLLSSLLFTHPNIPMRRWTLCSETSLVCLTGLFTFTNSNVLLIIHPLEVWT